MMHRSGLRSLKAAWLMGAILAIARPCEPFGEVERPAGGLKDASPLRRIQAAQALAALGSNGMWAKPQLVEALNDSDWGVRCAAAGALWAIARDKDLVVPTALAALKQGDPTTKTEAASLIADIGPSASAATSELAQALSDRDSNLRFAAAQALLYIGPAARSAEPALRERASAETDPTIQYEVKWALYAVNPPAHIPDIRRSLETDPGGSLLMVNVLLPLMGPERRELVPSVMDAIQHPSLASKRKRAGVSAGVAEQKARLQGIVILGALGKDAAEATPLLRKLSSSDSDSAIRAAAQEALKLIERS